MLIVVNSLCTKRALKETRRILDLYAERLTPNTWATPITQAGLEALHQQLRKTARRNTAVSCFRAGPRELELLWIVGSKHKFDDAGKCNLGGRKAPWVPLEDQWADGTMIVHLVGLAGLFHDLGKAVKAFQDMLRGKVQRNQVRHEWVSLRLLEAFVGEDTDEQWLRRLACLTSQDILSWTDDLKKDYLDSGTPLPSPFKSMKHAPLACALGWLSVSHHRLPTCPERARGPITGNFLEIQADWNETPTDPNEVAPFWEFLQGLSCIGVEWRRRAARLAQCLLPSAGNTALLEDPFICHSARLALMLGDHFFSSLTSPQKPSPTELCANTTEGNLNQSLKEHLLGVSLHGSGVAATMPTLGRALGGYKGKALLKRARGRFRWQNEAAEKARSLRLAAQEHGAFVVNMASTGTGKTVANAKMAYALADPERGLRCTFAVGLNTLTLQMGEAYRSLLGVGSDTLALRVGDRGRRLLFEWDGAPLEDGGGEKTGSSSSAPLEDEGVVIYKGSTPDHPILSRLNPTAQGFVSAPLMVCTIDQISPATESLRGGHQIAPTLRLLTSDVVLDEPDDLQVSDMPALLRLAYWIGLWGSRLTLSSATMPPDFVEGLFHAYFEGRKVHAKNRGPSFKGVPCLWVDEEGTQSEVVPGRGAFRKAHDGFARKRAEHLSEKAPKCMAVVRPISDSTDIPGFILGQALELHERFRQRDPHTGTDVSFGVVRLDHIRQVRALAKALYARGMPEGHHLHLCVYHSRYPLISRSHIEKVLGSTLERHEPGAALKRVEPELRAHEADQHLFIVLGTSVVEVGQDHDYDWAITEPTSMRSFLQLLGRVRRHREYVATEPNVVILGQNIRSLDGGDGPFYWRPGFEKGGYRLDTVKAKELFRVAELQAPTSAPRIYYEEARTLQPNKYFSDLEHRRLRDRMLPIPLNAPNQKSLNGTAWYTQPAQDALLTGTLQRRQAFRKRHQPETIVRFTPAGRLQEFSREALRWGEYPWVGCKDKVDELEDPTSSSVTPWAHGSWQQQVEALSASRNLSIEEVCARFTQVRLPTNKSGSIRWEWHPNLGFDRLRP